MKFISDFGRYILMIKDMFSRPENGKMYWKEFMHQCSEIGIGSLGIVVIISFFMGAAAAHTDVAVKKTPAPKAIICRGSKCGKANK